MAISTFLKKINNVISYSMALGFGLYIISSFGRMLSNLPLQIMGIYEHYNPMDILGDNQLNLGFISISFLISVIAFFIGYFLYQKRNIASL
jgi:ABC-2 type transport system permease protein